MAVKWIISVLHLAKSGNNSESVCMIQSHFRAPNRGVAVPVTTAVKTEIAADEITDSRTKLLVPALTGERLQKFEWEMMERAVAGYEPGGESVGKLCKDVLTEQGKSSNNPYSSWSSTPMSRVHLDRSKVHSVELVTARCEEDISWVFEVPGVDSIYIYDKCGKQKHMKNETRRLPQVQVLDGKLQKVAGSRNVKVTYVKLSNVGREGFAFLHHMLHREPYNPLVAVAFAQGELEMGLPRLREMANDCLESNCCLNFGNLMKAPKGFWLPYRAAKDICDCITAFSGEVCEEERDTWLSLRGEFMTTSTNIMHMLQLPRRRLIDELYATMGNSNDPIEGHYAERLWRVLLEGTDLDLHTRTVTSCGRFN